MNWHDMPVAMILFTSGVVGMKAKSARIRQHEDDLVSAG